MNFSIENQVIWFAPERTGGSITKKILENYSFTFLTEKSNLKSKDLRKSEHSHKNTVTEELKNFKKITNIRNPYDRVFGCYQKYYLEKPILKNSNNHKEKFVKWVSENFWSQGSHVFLSARYDDVENYFQKWTFDEIDVDFVIRMENMREDILNLPFISKTEDEIQRIDHLLQENEFLNERHHSFQDVYDLKSAKLVYEFFKPCFYKFGYNPFSFTREQLTDKEKISFIHHNYN